MSERRKVTLDTASRYRSANKKERRTMLKEFVALTGYNTKYAIHLLANIGKEQIITVDGKSVKVKVEHKTRKKRIYTHIYDDDVRVVLEKIWETFDYQCGKLLVPFMRANIDCIRLDNTFTMTDIVASKLKTISRSTVDRLLRKKKQDMRIRGTSGTVPVRRLNFIIPTETWQDCRDKPPGFTQIDLVQHDGGCPSGEFCYTMTTTDMATCWTVHRAHLNKAHSWVKESLTQEKETLPCGLKGIHPDCGSEFINNAIKAWCDENKVEMSKSRANHSNDNCFVEQKNFATVRKIVGYFRYEGIQARDALQAVWDTYDLLLNLYYPCMRLTKTEHQGSKKIRFYDDPRTPYQRILERDDVSNDIKQRLRKLTVDNPLITLKQKMNTALDTLTQFRHTVPEIVRPHGTLPPLKFGKAVNTQNG
jgi:hypothetical protein